MTQICKKYRDRALRDGLNSPAGEIWRKHSRHCPSCKTEIFIVQMLGEDAADGQQHISRKDYATLVEEVCENADSYKMTRKGYRLRCLWNFSMAAAVFLLLGTCAVLLGQNLSRKNSPKVFTADILSYKSVAMAIPDDSKRMDLFSDDSFSAGKTQGIFFMGPDDVSTTIVQTPFWDSTSERQLLELRDRVEQRRCDYTNMIDRELHE
ncbi:MAG: hypothetical protein WCS73_03150 [Lentisphaeria bacterium]